MSVIMGRWWASGPLQSYCGRQILPLLTQGLGASPSFSLGFPPVIGQVCEGNKMVQGCGVVRMCMALEAQIRFKSQLYHFPLGCLTLTELQLSQL